MLEKMPKIIFRRLLLVLTSPLPSPFLSFPCLGLPRDALFFLNAVRLDLPSFAMATEGVLRWWRGLFVPSSFANVVGGVVYKKVDACVPVVCATLCSLRD